MILSLFFWKAISFECSAPLKHPPSIPNGKLQVMFLITRHGIRTPNDAVMPQEVDGYWLCDAHDAVSPRMRVSQLSGVLRRYRQTIFHNQAPFPPNCDTGELLVEGMQQHRELGEFYSNYLIYETDFLPEDFNESLVEFRSTHYTRCYKSAQSFIDGFYPPQQKGEIINISVGSTTKEFLYPDPSTCPEMNQDWNDMVASDEYIKRRDAAKINYEPIYNYTGVEWDGFNWQWWGDSLIAYYCTGNPMPKVVTEEMFKQMVDDTQFAMPGFYNRRKGVAASPLWREIFLRIDEFLNKTTPIKFRLYSSHDSTIAGLLGSIGAYTISPPFRSHCTVELWKVKGKDIVRIVFNGEPVPIDIAGGKTTIELKKLKDGLSQYLNHCKYD